VLWRLLRNPRDEKILVVSATGNKSKEFVSQVKIDAGRPDLVLVLVASLLLLSLLCAGGARIGFRRAPVPVAAE
jgi:hypothetical protein